MLEALIAVSAIPLPEIDTDVIAPALNSPEVPRSTIVEAPFAVAAVVRAFATVPDDRFEALIPVKPPPAPLTVVNVPTLAVNDPLASLATIVEAPLAEAAVVRALAIVPDEMFEALILVIFVPTKVLGVPKFGVTRVGLVARTTEPVPVSVAKPSISKSQDAAVVPVIATQITLAVVPAITVPTKLPPDELTVIVPVLWLIISNAQPKASVLVTGKTTV